MSGYLVKGLPSGQVDYDDKYANTRREEGSHTGSGWGKDTSSTRVDGKGTS
jgi:hypothetical protein